jgi:hypothetical protein
MRCVQDVYVHHKSKNDYMEIVLKFNMNAQILIADKLTQSNFTCIRYPTSVMWLPSRVAQYMFGSCSLWISNQDVLA